MSNEPDLSDVVEILTADGGALPFSFSRTASTETGESPDP